MKKNRHAKIIEIIGKQEVETQEQLADLLRSEGYDVTQATVSRDIRDLRLTKIQGNSGRQKYCVTDTADEQLQSKYIQVLRSGYVSMECADNLLVIKTVSGMAMAVAAAVDALHIPDVLGCIAGDDTIFAAIRSKEGAVRVISQIMEMTAD
ncbi:arginine repressor [Butyrivibrio sp. MC2013]|uniref:arginine repressor n=1 Tax=Butyrivibrio sp. MC2013 TaxID=1280686 RepID=UPI000418AA14|nr:arginine repressor [Butyrivibrio sp. MC2013]